ncbi:MAG: SDR family oxidoreductase [Maricaulis sp.]|uniref:SDR family NAD(P)-dependent oxidoreductase n=1 Tax=Maricaulis sp. TaxID=1486257 RepID=UPI002616CB68|nr:SDR family oxidoreductase [Maricaulis sp.]MDM7983521.1 SDR family oxidoreductase [Maricaulis sp.]
MSTRLAGKTALVTGGSRGIGAAIAKAFAAEGSDVALSYGGSKAAAEAVAEEIRGMGRKAEAIHCDAAEVGATDKLVRGVVESFGKLDILVNNAGVYPLTTIAKCSDEQWERTMAINVRAPFEAFRAAYEVMEHGGSIITIGSVAAEAVMAPGIAVYSASKSGVQLLARGAARELGRKQIRSNVIQPGPIDTDMNPADGDKADFQKMMVPIGRYGTVEEISSLATFLASDESSYVNAAVINADGGMNS